MVLSKRMNILLIISLLLSVVLGGSHHCCVYYSQTCSISSPIDHQPILFLAQATAAVDIPSFPAASPPPQNDELFPDPILSYAPLRDRAPPRHS